MSEFYIEVTGIDAEHYWFPFAGSATIDDVKENQSDFEHTFKIFKSHIQIMTVSKIMCSEFCRTLTHYFGQNGECFLVTHDCLILPRLLQLKSVVMDFENIPISFRWTSIQHQQVSKPVPHMEWKFIFSCVQALPGKDLWRQEHPTWSAALGVRWQAVGT